VKLVLLASVATLASAVAISPVEAQVYGPNLQFCAQNYGYPSSFTGCITTTPAPQPVYYPAAQPRFYPVVQPRYYPVARPVYYPAPRYYGARQYDPYRVHIVRAELGYGYGRR
jgi:hypothetical protein